MWHPFWQFTSPEVVPANENAATIMRLSTLSLAGGTLVATAAAQSSMSATLNEISGMRSDALNKSTSMTDNALNLSTVLQ